MMALVSWPAFGGNGTFPLKWQGELSTRSGIGTMTITIGSGRLLGRGSCSRHPDQMDSPLSTQIYDEVYEVEGRLEGTGDSGAVDSRLGVYCIAHRPAGDYLHFREIVDQGAVRDVSSIAVGNTFTAQDGSETLLGSIAGASGTAFTLRLAP
jgi:hypothetical protein